MTGSSIKQKLAAEQLKYSSQITALDAEISATEREIERNNKIRESAITRLAEIYCENGGAVAKQFSDVNRRVQSIFSEKSARRDALIDKLKQLSDQERDINTRHAAINKSIGEQEDSIIDIKSRVALALKAHTAYNQLEVEIGELKTYITKDDARLKTLELDCKNQLDVFTNDKYFSYLLRINYGTPKYVAGWFPRMDRWLARVSHFDENLRKYNILKAIPPRVKLANEKRREIIAAKINQRDDIVAQIEAQYGLAPLCEDLKKNISTRAVLADELKKSISEQEALRKEKDRLDTDKDPFLKRAKEELKAMFNLEDIARLRTRAAQTQSPEDDKLVQQLAAADKAIDEQRAVAKKLIKDRKPLEQSLSRAKKLESEFVQAGYESSRSRFNDDFDADALIVGYMAGSIIESSVMSRFAAAYNPEPVYSSYSSYSSRSSSDDDDYRRSSSSSSSWSSSSSDSWGSSSSDSGGGFDSGGSDTGGGFD